jgi:hypothetical protein
MSMHATHTLIGILMVYVVVLNMVLSNILYNQRFRHNTSDTHAQPTQSALAVTTYPSIHAKTRATAEVETAGLLVLVLLHSHNTAAAPVARLMMQLRSVAWHVVPRIVLVMPRDTAMVQYNDWCLLTELQCDIAVLGDMSAAGLVRYIHNTDMCCTRAGVPTRDMLMLYETTVVHRGFARVVAGAAHNTVSCLQGSPCQAYYVPAAYIAANVSQWGVKHDV